MSDKPELIDAPFRIAFRVEGKMINAYFAKHDTMDDVILMGSILKIFCDGDPRVWEAFKALMRQAVNVVLTEVMGSEAQAFTESPAPESERAGNA